MNVTESASVVGSMSSTSYVDLCELATAEVGYGTLGTGGQLGYENKDVQAAGRSWPHALSTHPPSRLTFRIKRQFSSFSSMVALNDDVPAFRSYADFAVVVDGRVAAVESNVRAGEPPRKIEADTSGADHLELVVRTRAWEYSHAVWLDPKVTSHPPSTCQLTDCLDTTEIRPPIVSLRPERCVATLVTPGQESQVDDLLGSLFANGQCQDALILLLILDGTDACHQVAVKYGATAVCCRSRSPQTPAPRAMLYSIARIVQAQRFICMDPCTLVLGDLNPVFGALDACPRSSILVCRAANDLEPGNLCSLLHSRGTNAQPGVLQLTPEEQACLLATHGHLFAGRQEALFELDHHLRSISRGSACSEGGLTLRDREWLLFNVALARMRCAVELDPVYGVQARASTTQLHFDGPYPHAQSHGRSVRVLHFDPESENEPAEWHGRFARIKDPIAIGATVSAYSEFLRALQTWLGRYGLAGLAWSFYSKTDGRSAAVRDPATLPLLAALHYLVRSNGCVRILEAGTGRGISTACLASAIAHRLGGRIVTLDPLGHSGREELWAILPDHIRRCIDARKDGSIEGMRASLASGEAFDAALLDSIHTEEHVWAEFQFATRLVCPGGLILIHDAWYSDGSVEGALQRIERAGYNVVRLWTADSGIPEDDHLGLAVVENRCRRHLR